MTSVERWYSKLTPEFVRRSGLSSNPGTPENSVSFGEILENHNRRVFFLYVCMNDRLPCSLALQSQVKCQATFLFFDLKIAPKVCFDKPVQNCWQFVSVHYTLQSTVLLQAVDDHNDISRAGHVSCCDFKHDSKEG